MKQSKFSVGDRVKFTGKFLHNTGQYTGSDAFGEWTVIECDCEMCQHDCVAVNEPSIHSPDYQRHISVGNLMLANEPDYSNL